MGVIAKTVSLHPYPQPWPISTQNPWESFLKWWVSPIYTPTQPWTIYQYHEPMRVIAKTLSHPPILKPFICTLNRNLPACECKWICLWPTSNWVKMVSMRAPFLILQYPEPMVSVFNQKTPPPPKYIRTHYSWELCIAQIKSTSLLIITLNIGGLVYSPMHCHTDWI